jgi:methyl-accepting chemotaxis protein
MSATSEELAAQAEQLQAAIGYFHTNDDASPAARAVPVHRPVHERLAAAPTTKNRVARPVPIRRVATNGSGAKPNGHAVPDKGNGFAIDLAPGGGDSHDKEFVRY